jgi:hypothetical protein
MESRNIKNANTQIEKHGEDHHTPHNKIQNEFTVKKNKNKNFLNHNNLISTS